jgi:hypothetical protein
MGIRGGLAMTLVVIPLGAGGAHAETPQRVRLRYAAPTECPDDLELVQAVEGFLGQSLRDAREQSLTIDARVQGDPRAGYSAKLAFEGPEGSVVRFVDHVNCAKLIEAAALMVAIAIDPERVRQRHQADDGAPSKAAEPDPERVAVSAKPAPPSPEVAAVARAGKQATLIPPLGATAGPALRPQVALLALANGGMLPSVAPGLGAEMSFRYHWAEVGIGGRLWAARSETVPAARASSIDLSLTAAIIRLCGVPSTGRWSLPLCVGGHLGDMQGTGQQVDHARTRHGTFAAVSGGATLAYSAGRFVPLVGVDLYAIVARPQFGVELNGQETPVFQSRPWGLGGFVGLAYKL